MTPVEILPTLVEFSIAIAGFSGIAVAVQERSERSSQSRIFLSSLLLSTFVSCALSLFAMVALTTPLAESTSWSLTSCIHAAACAGILVTRAQQQRRGAYVRTLPLQIARALLLALVAAQSLNGLVLHEPWVAVLGLCVYAFFGFGFFVSLLLELVRPNAEQRVAAADPSPTRSS